MGIGWQLDINMMKFSEKTQAFYATNLNYPNLPDDLVEVSAEDHLILLGKINAGHRVFSDLTHSEKRPSSTHVWENGEWVDSLTPAQKYEQYLKSLRPLTRRQFMLTLVEYGLDDDIAAAINTIEDEKQRKIINIEFNNSQTFERMSDSVLFMCNLVGLEETRVNELWEYGMRL